MLFEDMESAFTTTITGFVEDVGNPAISEVTTI